MEGGKEYAAVKNWDLDYFKTTGTFKFLTPNDIPKGQTDLMEVAYNGFGFLLTKYGVFENLEYPYFMPEVTTFGEDVIDFASEDVSFCRRATNNGFKIYVDPTVVVGHEKTSILMP